MRFNVNFVFLPFAFYFTLLQCVEFSLQLIFKLQLYFKFHIYPAKIHCDSKLKHF